MLQLLLFASCKWRPHPSFLIRSLEKEEIMDIKELEKRVRVLEDLEEIKRLKALYAEICDG